MKTKGILAILFLAVFSFTACKKEAPKKTETKEVVAANLQKVSLNISGMTCEIGCAKTIQSKLSKKEGVAKATVVFTDSIAKVEYDANKISADDLVTFIDGIAGGDMYKATKIETK